MDDATELNLMVQAAELYYELDLTQHEIAEKLGVSRPKVSLLLTAARKQGIVRISVSHPVSRAGETGAELAARYGLSEAVVVPVTTDDRTLLTMKIGSWAARYLEDRLNSGETLGIGRGRTVYQTVTHLEPRRHMNVTVVPLCGGEGSDLSEFQVNEMCRFAAQRLGGRCFFLHAPAKVLTLEAYRALMDLPEIEEVVRHWDNLDWILIGVGSTSIPWDPLYSKDIEAAQRYSSVRPVADLCLRLLDPNGRGIEFPRSDYLVGVTPEQIRSAKRVVGVAGGTYKADAILAALRGRWLDTLIVDEPTARAILHQDC
ncbi:MAG: sugar-binding transcriptional regulator [Firmicutes bacterium]|nr:sugar-binding transcriptional regulator [Bacillota bacterium]